MGFLQQFHLIIRYKKRMYNKVAYILSRPIINTSTILKHNSITHESFIEQYAQDEDFIYLYPTLSKGNQIEELDYHVHDKLLYHLGQLCIP